MRNETHFRLALAAVFVLSIAIAGYYRVQAAKSGEVVSRRGEGLPLFTAIRLTGLLLFAATLLYLLHPPWVRWAGLPLSDGLRWTGLFVGLLAAALVQRTLRALGGNLTDTVATRADHSLVTTGPYRWVRHPYYTATLLLVAAATLLAANWLIGLLGLLVFLLLAIRTPLEERKLIERFGDDYRRYMQRTGRFFPRLRSRARAKH
jgi:protein-S-isoprenylcysteine O-methyltransferase Ste14